MRAACGGESGGDPEATPRFLVTNLDYDPYVGRRFGSFVAEALIGEGAMGKVYRAAREVALPVASGISIIIIVFLPLLTLQGLEGKLFIPVALTIVFALSASLVLSLTAIAVALLYRQFKKSGWL